MLKFYRETNVYFKTVILSLLVIAGLVVLCIPFFFFKLQEIPQGIALGGLVGVLYYIFAGFNYHEEYSNKAMIFDKYDLFMSDSFFVDCKWLYFSQLYHSFSPKSMEFRES